MLAAVPEREDVRDVLVARDGRKLADLPAGARIGTGSPRRAAQLRLVRPDLEVVAVRGNVDTRVGYVASGRLDGVVLAYAGLNRLGRIAEATELFDPADFLPAPGQGALAVECREDDAELRALLGGPGPRAHPGRGHRRALAARRAGGGLPRAGRRLRAAEPRERAGTDLDRDRRLGRGATPRRRERPPACAAR